MGVDPQLLIMVLVSIVGALATAYLGLVLWFLNKHLGEHDKLKNRVTELERKQSGISAQIIRLDDMRSEVRHISDRVDEIWQQLAK